MPKTFLGGIKLKGFKRTRTKAIKYFDEPHSVAIPLCGANGVVCKANVSIGEKVSAGQMIGLPTGEPCCPVFASISGFIRDIETRKGPDGTERQYVVIDNDFKNDFCDHIRPHCKSLLGTSNEEFITLIKNAGIVGAYSGYPVYAKLTEAGTKVRRVLINCMESEPYITAGYRLLLERTLDVINGTKVLIKITGAYGAIIAVDETRANVIKALDEHIKDKNLIEIRPLKAKYPQGDENQLIYTVFNRIELQDGKKPADIGCIVFNPETAANVFSSIASGVPVIRKLITVGGSAVANPVNLSVPIGTSFKEIIDFCGGFSEEPAVVIDGGPMTGVAADVSDSVVTGYTRGITALSEGEDEEGECIRCGRCVSVCPMHLLPPYINDFAKAGDLEMCEKYSILRCIECGCCGYICPSKVPIFDRIRNARKEILSKKSKEKGD